MKLEIGKTYIFKSQCGNRHDGKRCDVYMMPKNVSYVYIYFQDDVRDVPPRRFSRECLFPLYQWEDF